MRFSKPSTLAELLASSAMLGARTAHISLADWQRAVGARLAQKTLPERLSEGLLTVRVPSSAWAQELSLLSDIVAERLRTAGHAVQRLRFQVHATSQSADVALTTVRRAELPARLRESLEQVEDPDLRRAIAEAAAYSLARQPL